MKYNSFLAQISIITKSYLPWRVPQKPEEFKVTLCAAIVTLSCIAHPLHSIRNTMKQNSNNALWSTK